MSGLVTGGALLLCALGSGSGLRVETSTPDALCPDLGQVRAAARARLGDIEADGDWNASYALIHRPDGAESGDIVRLTLHDPAGRLRLQRELPRAGESCASLAQALVVILDAYFRHPTDTEELAAPVPEPMARATAIAPVAPPSERLAVDLSAGWSGAWRGADRQSPVLALGLRAELAPLWWAGIEGTWLTSSVTQTFATPSGNLSASLRSYGLRGYFARDLLHGPRARLLVAPEVMLGLDRADGAMLLEGSRETRPSFGAGLRAQLRLRLVQALWLSVLATLDYMPAAWGGTFAVRDSPTADSPSHDIFPPSRLRLMAGAGLSWTVF